MESIAATQVMAQFVVLSIRSRHARNLAPIVVRDEIDEFLRRAGNIRAGVRVSKSCGECLHCSCDPQIHVDRVRTKYLITRLASSVPREPSTHLVVRISSYLVDNFADCIKDALEFVWRAAVWWHEVNRVAERPD